jgi:hypothetical protein
VETLVGPVADDEFAPPRVDAVSMIAVGEGCPSA